jgi:hypothetical protein
MLRGRYVLRLIAVDRVLHTVVLGRWQPPSCGSSRTANGSTPCSSTSSTPRRTASAGGRESGRTRTQNLFTVPASTLWSLRLTHPFEPVQHPATG